MKDPAGNPFGDRSYIEIDVQELTLPSSPPNCTNEDTPEHGIIPVVKPGGKIHKAWFLKNTGTCHWDKGHILVYVGGAKMVWESPYVSPTISGGKAVVLVTLLR